MKKIILLVFVLPLFVFSQNNPNREYWQINRWDAKTGMTAEFESAVAKKTKKYNTTTENGIMTFQIITGPDQGKYMRVVGPKESAFFDEGFSDEYSYWQKNVMPYVADSNGNKRTWRVTGLGYNWDNDQPPMNYVRFTTVRLKSGLGRDFFHFLANDAKVKMEHGFTGVRGVFLLESGGQWEVHIVEPYNSHAEPRGKYPAEDFDYRDAYNEINGWRALEHDRKKRDEAIRDYGGEIIETLMFRPEMSTSIE